jgi:O-antigen/teichoic acid export membrane protein
MLTVVAVCVIAPLFPLAHDLISLWINNDVAREGGLVLQTLAIAGMLGSATNATYFFLLGTGRTRTITLLAVITGVVTVIVSALVLPRYGLRAAGWSGIAAMIAQMAFVLIVLRNVFGTVLSWSTIITSLHIPILVGLLIALLIARIGHSVITTWPGLILVYFMLAALMFVATMVVNSLLPHGRERYKYIKKLIINLLPMREASGDI